MKSKATGKFWAGYRQLPVEVRKIAAKQHRLWLKDPSHPSLKFKKVQDFWSCRVTDSFRALGVMDGDTVVWFWIGSHSEYERLIKRR
ncbi:MAG: hypothetical protein KDM63_15775 [Verrucomicrobiae bacterium]|nr:hypothetical protein [Verrucomicrobiae bacterium]